MAVSVEPVLFGFRVRLGHATDINEFYTDWCAGMGAGAVNVLLQFSIHAGLTLPINEILRSSEIKPVWNDPEFMGWAVSKCNPPEVYPVTVTAEKLEHLRALYQIPSILQSWVDR